MAARPPPRQMRSRPPNSRGRPRVSRNVAGVQERVVAMGRPSPGRGASMARQRSVKYSSRRLRGWQLAALAGAVGALAVAGCSSSTSSSGTSGSTAPAAGGSSSAPGNATSGSITWWASPINTSGKDVRQVLISDFEAKYPGIKVSLTSAPTEHRHQPGHAGHRHLGRGGHPGRVHGRRDLARSVRRAPAGGAAVELPAGQLLGPVRARAGPGRHVQGPDLRVADVRGPGVLVLPQGPAGQGAPAGAHDLGAAAVRVRDAAEGRAGQVRVRLPGRLVRGPDLQLHGVPDRRRRHA